MSKKKKKTLPWKMAQMASLLNTINTEGRNTVSLIQLFPSWEEKPSVFYKAVWETPKPDNKHGCRGRQRRISQAEVPAKGPKLQGKEQCDQGVFSLGKLECLTVRITVIHPESEGRNAIGMWQHSTLLHSKNFQCHGKQEEISSIW